jgi:hypothetical protein
MPVGSALAATYLSLLPVLHGTKGTPPQLRVYFPPTYVAVASLLAAAFLLGVWLRQQRGHLITARPQAQWAVAGLTVILALACLPAPFSKGETLIQEMRTFEDAWTARDTSLREQTAAGKKVLYCHRLPGARHDVLNNSTHYVNVYMALNYTRDKSVRVVLVKDGAAIPNPKASANTAPPPAQNGTG